VSIIGISPDFLVADASVPDNPSRPLKYVGTNAYWLHTLSEEDIDKTLTDIAAAGIKVVRTWAFNSMSDH
jgi:mannan endo-1,4-beta-mannosidase